MKFDSKAASVLVIGLVVASPVFAAETSAPTVKEDPHAQDPIPEVKPAKPATSPTPTPTPAPSKTSADDDHPYRPRFTSPLYKQVIAAEAPVSDLPAWHGNHFWKEEQRKRIIPQLNGWTEHLYNAIAADGDNLISKVPRRIEFFCPNYKSLDREKRIAFWARMISVMASYESSFEPKMTFLEPTLHVLSSGLLQISHGSAMEPKYNCDMISPDPEQGQKDLFDPKKNLSCAVRIINYWVGHDGTMVEFVDNGDPSDDYWKGLARYWGVFRHKLIKEDPDEYWKAILNRHQRWQEIGMKRDEFLLERYRTANDDDAAWTNRDWEAQGTLAAHPSLTEDKFDDEESQPLTSMLRLVNQTAFCYQK